VTKVDFYIHNTAARDDAHERTMCKLAEKISTQGKRVYIHAEAQSQRLDTLLWTFREGSFVAHELYQPGVATEVAVQIGAHPSPEIDSDVLINLAAEVPLFFSRFPRVAELVGSSDTAKKQGRERYRFYRDRGYTLDMHELGR